MLPIEAAAGHARDGDGSRRERIWVLQSPNVLCLSEIVLVRLKKSRFYTNAVQPRGAESQARHRPRRASNLGLVMHDGERDVDSRRVLGRSRGDRVVARQQGRQRVEEVRQRGVA